MTAPLIETGILKSINAQYEQLDLGIWKLKAQEEGPIKLKLAQGPSFVLDRTEQWHVLPMDEEHQLLNGSGYAWVLPMDPDSVDSSLLIKAEGEITLESVRGTITVSISAQTCMLIAHESRPQADCFGKRYRFDFEHGGKLAHTLACLYWGTMLPSVIERTRASQYPISEGYVLSTLKSMYGGTYPDVDHEFQIKGRLAWGNSLDYDVIRRMIELQLKVMREDPEGLWRNPCAIQPDGTREYHVRRNSLDGSTNATMFLITGNVEVLESTWLYVAATKEMDWLRLHIEELEGAASCIEDYIDRHGRLWSDVYYEDQVMKDGRETFATALAANSFRLLAEMESQLGRETKAEHYIEIAGRLVAGLVKPLPLGYWDESNNRFVDWVDRSGVPHDHIHLLANILPVLFGYTSQEQSTSVLALIDEYFDQFQRFPTFLAAEIDQYTDSEIGDGGPYDLCAAGRYWCWDAAFWSWQQNRKVLLGQLIRVSEQAEKEGYVMGERYDMNYIYYQDEKDWHGAAHYYEYPCVFSWVLMHEYIGINQTFEADFKIAPRLQNYGEVELLQDGYLLSYTYLENEFQLTNLAAVNRSFTVDLAALYPNVRQWKYLNGEVETVLESGALVVLEPGLKGHWFPIYVGAETYS